MTFFAEEHKFPKNVDIDTFLWCLPNRLITKILYRQLFILSQQKQMVLSLDRF